jgi:hypothetical protein
MQPVTTRSPEQLDNLARQLRSAVLAGDHTGAERVVSEYTQALRQAWDAMPEPQRAASPLPNQVVELWAWAREMTLVQRALAAEHLAIVRTASHYEPSQASDAYSPIIDVEA